jgi:hypothetical protein
MNQIEKMGCSKNTQNPKIVEKLCFLDILISILISGNVLTHICQIFNKKYHLNKKIEKTMCFLKHNILSKI